MLIAASASLAFAAQTMVVPVDGLAGWTSLAYRSIPANTVSIANEGSENASLQIKVDRSSSPLVFRLDEPAFLSGFTVQATWSGNLLVPAGKTQGEEGADDFVLKLGLVEAGERKLNFLQRRLAPDWIVQLHDLAPAGSGVRRISFYSTTRQEAELGKRRTHPLSDLLYEERVHYLEKSGPFELSYSFADPVKVLGLWISSDGDDTGSEFTLEIQNIDLILTED